MSLSVIEIAARHRAEDERTVRNEALDLLEDLARALSVTLFVIRECPRCGAFADSLADYTSLILRAVVDIEGTETRL
jgi:hypothetical protein